ncbi:MAG: HEAT repeat domain-containing protein [Myxococcales bacterium]|nr:HEAT repeat domain-containing protein [Myxococcales bacterium]
MSDRNHKSWARLRALVSNVTLASLATASTAAAATSSATTTTEPADDHPAEPARALALRLAELPSIESMGVAAELALSPDLHERRGLADALGWAFPLPGEQAVIEHLASDPTPEVRAAAARAAWVRRSSQLDVRVLHRLLGDDDPEVRAAAWLAVSR